MDAKKKTAAKKTAKKTAAKTRRTTGAEPYFGDCRNPENRAKRDAWRAENK